MLTNDVMVASIRDSLFINLVDLIEIFRSFRQFLKVNAASFNILLIIITHNIRTIRRCTTHADAGT